MSSITVVTDAGGDRTPLLRDSHLEFSGAEAEYPEPPPPKVSSDTKQRLVSLDVFRGLTVALMILVDDAGGAFPAINHSPWFGVTLADFVMPFFLFGVGVSVSLVFKKVANRVEATKKVMLRFLKLFVLGVILQGGYFHGCGDLTYGIDVEKIRVMGVLQRIAIGYMLASVLEIWLVNNTVVNSTVTFLKRYSFQIVAGLLVGALYMVLLYSLYVPDWEFDVSSLNTILPSLLGPNSKTVHCGLKGSLEPPCNAVGSIDRAIVGENHLYQHPVYIRTKDTRTGVIIGRGTEQNGLYYVDEIAQPSQALSTSTARDEEAWLWHRRLGHPSMGYLKTLFPKFASNSIQCDTCMLAKSHRSSFKPTNTRMDSVFSLIHSDVWGPAPILGGQQFKYFLLFIDDCTRMTWVYFIKQKSQVFEKFSHFCAMIQTQFHRKIQILRSDNGGEYTSDTMKVFCRDNGIIHQTTCPYTPEQNGVAERKNRIILEITRAMMIESKVPHSFWPEAIATAVYLLNRLPTKTLNLKTPLQALSDKVTVPPTHKLQPRVFGCSVFVHVPKHERSKLSPCAIKCVFVGYGVHQKGYRCYNPKTRQIITTIHCNFLETEYFYVHNHLSSQGELSTTNSDDSLRWLLSGSCSVEDANSETKVQPTATVPCTPESLPERVSEECSVNSPDYGPLPSNSPSWCLAPFDPEGILSSLMASITCFVGLHYGHILVHCKEQMQRVIFWSVSSLTLLVSGYLLTLAGVPLSKPLYTLSYMFVTAGASGVVLIVIYFIVDTRRIRKPTLIFQWMGMNALIVYALAACDIFPAAVQGFYWHSPENNLVDLSERLMQSLFHSEKWGTLVFVLMEILFWGFVAGFLHMKRIYIKF